MLVKTYGASVYGIDAATITIEVNLANGINFHLVGLPDSAVKESQQRIKAAFMNNQYKFPGKEVTINMSPADIRKEGSVFDLPIAIGILGASEQVPDNLLKEYMFLGELSLDGKLNPLKGVLSIALRAKEDGFKGIVLPEENANEAAMVEGLEVYGVSNLKQVVSWLRNECVIEPVKVDMDRLFLTGAKQLGIDFSDVKGQMSVKRAFEIAAAGGHNVILIGPPGAGKSMLAKRFPTILPPMTMEESLETTKIHSVVGKVKAEKGLITERPFRKPHHTISEVALVGGGSYPQPGELSLAHNGVLFLDELPEYKRSVLEVMRQPLEDGTVTISRARFSVTYSSNTCLIATCNPCKCGYLTHPTRNCDCSTHEVKRYFDKISGPLLDRIDLHIEVTPVDYEDMSSELPQEGSEVIRKRVVKARNKQLRRFQKDSVSIREERYIPKSNADMSSRDVKSHCQLDEQGKEILKKAMTNLGLSARAYDKILKVSRTIADLDGAENVEVKHIAEAIQYRSLDRDSWGTTV